MSDTTSKAAAIEANVAALRAFAAKRAALFERGEWTREEMEEISYQMTRISVEIQMLRDSTYCPW